MTLTPSIMMISMPSTTMTWLALSMSNWPAVLYWIYVVIGPLAWAAIIAAAVFASARMSRLRNSRAGLPTPTPTLAIIVPARNEGPDIAACLGSILGQDYPTFQLIGVDDRSTDDTAGRMRAIAATDRRLQVRSVDTLPEGWLGKCHALQVGTQDVHAEWLLFIDSDVRLNPSAARAVVSMCVERGVDVLSIFPRLYAPSFWETTLLPILATGWAAAFKASMTNDDSRRHLAVANGQFLLCRSSWYRRIGGHEAVKDRIVEDVEIMRRLKRDGAKVRLMFGQHLATTRMHTSLRQMRDGWARIYAGTGGRSVVPPLGVAMFLLLGTASVAAALCVPDPKWQFTAAMHLAMIVGFSTWMYVGSGQRWWNVLFLPLTIPMTLFLLFNAARVCLTGKVDWRGNRVLVK
jgi:chlorobactene glucosyltransferase